MEVKELEKLMYVRWSLSVGLKDEQMEILIIIWIYTQPLWDWK